MYMRFDASHVKFRLTAKNEFVRKLCTYAHTKKQNEQTRAQQDFLWCLA